MTATPLLSVRNLAKHYVHGHGFFGLGKRTVKAVQDVSFDIARGETLSLVGESGCGKSTVGKAIAGLHPATHGEILLNGKPITSPEYKAGQLWHRKVQVVFQDPYSSLDPRMRVRDIIAEPLKNFGLAKDRQDLNAQIARLIDLVRLPRDSADRYPHEFSGGQRQRIGIARALAPNPELIICDEAVSALDVSVKAQIVNLLADLRNELGLALLFISHDLAIVDHITDRVAVMYLGRIVEIGSRNEIFDNPKHPYTRALLSAVPMVDPAARRERIILKGELPSPFNPPSGCTFRTRCPLAQDLCAHDIPRLTPVGGNQQAACHLLPMAPATIA
ncbi:oligopeptide/dipeptide ABC transporter ATP-binding protein [uncultured Ferrovibrio sp.]|jgi:peptide/nickel transport system ATP-binding protein|uniref:ABC transporter ATP-binding protein n=1 Tax=uncultured Ferrovibrio sp. TaxID=1576913 RepID=UPI00261AC744|nr:oligopeptide/dipeptide ABC transporter ATP-binding protein [uncultured Ferrovibrio sp.]